MTNEPLHSSDVDPRLTEVTKLSRFQRRVYIYSYLPVLAVLILWALLAFIPGPLHSYSEDLCLRILGTVSSRALIFGSAIFVVVLFLALVSILRLTGVRFPDVNGPIDRLAFLRRQLLAEGMAPHKLGISTQEARRSHLLWTGVCCILLTCLVCGGIYLVENRTSADQSLVREVTLGSENRLQTGRFHMKAVARLDLAFEIVEESYGVSILSGTRADINRLGRHGFTPIASSRYRNSLIVPLVPQTWNPTQPIEVFYQCDAKCGFTIPAGSPLLWTHVRLGGRLLRSALPFFVQRTFERAGIKVASPYFVLTNADENPYSAIAIVAAVGFVTAAFFFALRFVWDK